MYIYWDIEPFGTQTVHFSKKLGYAADVNLYDALFISLCNRFLTNHESLVFRGDHIKIIFD